VETPAGCKTCHLLNISQCGVSEHSEQFVLTPYNPLSRPVTEFVRLPIPSETAYRVVDPSGLRLTVQFVPLPSAVLRIPGRESSATAELVFQADDLPPLGYKSYLVTKESSSSYLNTLRAKRSAESETGGPVDIGDRVSITVVILLGIRHYYILLLSSPITKLVYFTYFDLNESTGIIVENVHNNMTYFQQFFRTFSQKRFLYLKNQFD